METKEKYVYIKALIAPFVKIFTDTLQDKDGRYSRKSITAVAAFAASICYEIVLPIIYHHMFNEKFETKQYVFDGLLMFSAASLGGTLIEKLKSTV